MYVEMFLTNTNERDRHAELAPYSKFGTYRFLLLLLLLLLFFLLSHHRHPHRTQVLPNNALPKVPRPPELSFLSKQSGQDVF